MKLLFKNPIFVRTLESSPILCVDVGARKGLKKEWVGLSRYLEMVIFEPDQDEYERLKADQKIKYSFNSCVWNEKKELVFNLAKDPGLSSCREVNWDFLNQFNPTNTSGYKTESRVTFPADTLNNILSSNLKKSVNLLKVDVEGSCFEVLDGASEILAGNHLYGINIEAEYNPKWAGQKLFSDVDQKLRENGFEIYSSKNCYWKHLHGTKLGSSKTGRLIHRDFFYLLNVDIFLKRLQNLNDTEFLTEVLKYILIACMYSAFDAAANLINALKTQKLLSELLISDIEKPILKTGSYLFRFENLKNHSDLKKQLLYHVGMAVFGIWMKQTKYWSPQVIVTE